MSFETDVLEKSKSTPVVVDFWAPWCGPCRFLGPVIEELAASTKNWELVKINTDEHRELMQQYQIQGIPAVKMFIDGKVTAEFTGALPKHQIEKWLEDNLPNETREQFSRVVTDLANNKPDALLNLEEFAAANPDHEEAALILAEKIVFQDPNKAVALTERIKLGNPLFDHAEQIRVINQLLNSSCEDDSIAGKSLNEGVQNLREQNLENAIGCFIESISSDKKICDELARKGLIAIFSLLGKDHDLTKRYRRKFDMALY